MSLRQREHNEVLEIQRNRVRGLNWNEHKRYQMLGYIFICRILEKVSITVLSLICFA